MRTLFFFFALIFCSVTSSWAGNSLSISYPSTVSNPNVPAAPINGPCRVEMMVHGLDTDPTGSGTASVGVCGYVWQWSQGRVFLWPTAVTGGNLCIIDVKAHLQTGFALRWQTIPEGAGGTITCEAWDLEGNYIGSASEPYAGTAGSHSDGVSLTGTGGVVKNVSWDFFKIFTTTVPMRSRMPVNGEDGNLLSWRFDNNLNDSSGNGYTGTLSGSASYSNSPGQNLMYGFIRTDPHPTWTERRTLRVGVPNQIDASGSYSQADGNPSVSCNWSVKSTKPVGLTLAIDDATDNCKPKFTPSGFGDYEVCLEMTNSSMSTDEDCVHFGAAEMNPQGIVQSANPDVTKIFGPMIALGWNPWGLADERAVFAHAARRAYYQTTPLTNSFPYSNPSWDNPLPGTVRYRWNGVGYAGTMGAGTATTQAVNPTEMDIDIADASVLDLSELPTKIQLSSSYAYNFEEIDICAATATSGPATLTVCYDGRGKDDAYGSGYVLGPTDWPAGTVVGQSLIKGTGTNFMGGTNTFCPAGAGPMGPIDYQAGTVRVTAGSAAIIGNGTTWSQDNKVYVGDAVRIQATHSGIPFIFFAYVSSVDSPTNITMNRIFPANADSANTLTYQIIRPFYRYPVTSFVRHTADGKGLMTWGGTTCASDTQIFFNTGIGGGDVSDYNARLYTGESIAFFDQDYAYLNQNATGGINFYGESMAWRILHHRSGIAEYKETANMLDDHYIRYPAFRGVISPYASSSLFVGGAFVSAIAAKVLDIESKLDWSDIRLLFSASKYFADSGTCFSADSRDTGYLEIPVMMGALLDPDPSYRSQWREAAKKIEVLEKKCKGANSSWANPFYRNPSGKPEITLTNGSTTGTGSGFASTICQGRASGTFSISGQTITATSGVFHATGTNPSNNYIILRDSSGFRVFTEMTSGGGATATIPVEWNGQSTGSWMQLEGRGMSILWKEEGIDTDPAIEALLEKNYECTYVDSSTVKLERPWEGPSGTYKLMNSADHGIGIAGKGQQPFMLSIRMYSYVLGAQMDSELGTDFKSLRDAAGTFIATNGYDEQIRGIRYGTNFQSCEPKLRSVTPSAWKQPGCSYGTDIYGVMAARMLNGEASRGFVSNTAGTLARGDDAYSALWCSTRYNDKILYPDIPACDEYAPGNSVGVFNLADNSLSGGKWPGFFFGMGMMHQWPAVRLTLSKDTKIPSPPLRLRQAQ